MQEALIVDTKTAAKLLSICTTSLRKRTNAGLIPHIKIGKRTFYGLPQL